MSETPNDLSPALGGGPGEWPFNTPPIVTFQPPWHVEGLDRSISVVDRLMRQRDEAYEGMRFWLAQAEADHRIATQGHFPPDEQPNREAGERFARRRPTIFGGGRNTLSVDHWMGN